MANKEITIDVDAQKAIKAINDLERETGELIIKKNALLNIQTRLEVSKKKDIKGLEETSLRLKGVTAAIKNNNAKMTEAIEATDVSLLSYNQLNKLLPKLRGQFQAINKSQDPASWDKYYKKLQDAEKQLKAVSGRVQLVKEKMTWKESAMAGIKNLVPGLGVANIAGQALSKVGDFIAGAWDRAKSVQSEAAKASRVFGSELGYVEMQAEKVAARAGLTNKEFVAMATNTADLLVPMGFTRKASAEMAVDMQKLTGALVEWSNGKFTAEDVSMRLTKAMMGETEGLKELGIGIRKDSEEYKTLVKEKEKGEGVTKAQAEALATLELVMKKSVDAQDEYANGGSALMKMGRDVGRMWRSMTESVATYIATSREDRMFEQGRKLSALNSEMKDHDDKLGALIPRYEELTTKSELSKDEHEELNRVVKDIIKIVPSAADAWDAEGKAISVNTEVVKSNMSARKALLLAQNKKLTEDLSDDLNKQFSVLNRNKDLRSTAVKNRKTLGDDYTYTKNIGLYGIERVEKKRSDDIIEYTKEIDKAQKSAYRTIAANLELGLSFQDIAENSGLAKEVVESVYTTQDREVNPTLYNENDGTKKTAEQLAKEEEDRKKEAERTAKAEADKQKNEEIAEKAREKAKQNAEKEAEQKKKDAEKAIEDQKKLEQDIKDAAIALSGDELKIEQDRYDKKLQALKLYGVDKATLNAEQLAALEGLEREHQSNVDKIEDSAVASFLSKNDKQFNRELTDLKIKQAEELAAFKGTKEEKEKLEKEHQEELKNLSAKGLEDTIKSITTLLSGENLTGLTEMVLSDEQKEELDAKLADVKLKLAELKGGSGEDEKTEEENPFKIDGSSTDVLGMTPDSWGQLQANLKNGKVGLGEMVAVAKALSAAYGMYNEMATANEKRQLADFEKKNEQKKDILKRRLESGAISQEEYNAQVASMDEELDAKKQEMEIKQAKRNKVQALFDIAIATAVAIASAMKTIWLVPVIAALGAAQVAMVLATPLPGKEKGGFLAEREDGKKFEAEYAPTKRGYITKPTVITGENGSEYVIPSDGLRNPSIAAVISTIESARLRGNIRDVNLYTPIQGKEQGGYISKKTSASTSFSSNIRTIEQLDRLTVILDKLERNGIKASVNTMGDGGIVENINKVLKIQNRTTI